MDIHGIWAAVCNEQAPAVTNVTTPTTANERFKGATPTTFDYRHPRYLFNGDIADRGDRAVEIFALVLGWMVACPGSVVSQRYYSL